MTALLLELLERRLNDKIADATATRNEKRERRQECLDSGQNLAAEGFDVDYLLSCGEVEGLRVALAQVSKLKAEASA